MPTASTLPVPAALTRGVVLQVVDYTEIELAATANAQGLAYQSTDILAASQLLRIERIVVTGDSANLCQVGIYLGPDPTLAQRIRDWTPLPAGMIAVAEYPSLLTIGSNNCVTFAVTGANEGDYFTCAIQYQLVLKRVS